MSKMNRKLCTALIIGVLISSVSYFIPRHDYAFDPGFIPNNCVDYDYTMHGVPLSFIEKGQTTTYCPERLSSNHFSVINYLGDILIWGSISFTVALGINRRRLQK